MRRRRNDYRSWEELSRQERRRGLAILGVAGAGAVAAVYLVVGSGGTQAEAGAAVPPTVDVSSQLATWYAGTAGIRGEITTSVSAVRTDIQAADGAALKPACAQLGQAVDRITGLGVPPVAAAGRTWTDGAAAYAQAVTACGNLFDGTAQPPPVLLQRTTDALNTADGHWTRLAAQIGAPAQIIDAAG
ncbi:hypothetical protein [Candidatus Frankia alpina]|uniref:hypothetical protein n=1 Tax=Candidatus Frankia alpina TaxID=2699483 RepID=UPI0013D849C8|nr:hypothetical protein [Candidatus Frankia alpina]